MPADRGLPATADGAEYGIVLAFVILRAFDGLQLALAAPGSVTRSPFPALDLVLIVGFWCWSGVLCTVLVRRRRFSAPGLVWADVAVGTVVLAATPWFTQPPDRFSSWAGWGYAVTLSVVVGAGVGLARWWQTLAVVAWFTGLYLAVTLPAATTPTLAATAVTNALAYLMFAAVIRFPAGYLRRLGATADAAQAQAAASAADAERARHRLLLHDQASVLALLSRADIDPALAAVARTQAASGAVRVRAFLSDDTGPASPLADQLAALAAEFGDLDPTVTTDQVRDDLDDRAVAVITDAVRTLLHNIRNHAHAHDVVIHAATTPTRWQVQVSDDGTGYDPAATAEGFGLTHQVRGPVTGLGGQVRVTTAPGEGTTVLLTGPTHPGLAS